MAEITLPDLSLIWASAGDVLQPSDTKIQQGWQVEVPPRQWFNWLDQRQDQAIAHIAQHGIAVWSAELEYQAGKSYVQGSDGLVYKALTTNTNINPVGGAPGNWESAFLAADQAIQVASAAQSRAMTANNVYLSPLQLANAFTGTRQQLSTSGWQDMPGTGGVGLVAQWGQGVITASTSVAITFPKQFVTACVALIPVHSTSGTPSPLGTNLVTISGATIRAPVSGTYSFNYLAIGF